MMVTRVRTLKLIQILISMLAKGHEFVDIELDKPNTLNVYPSAPSAVKQKERQKSVPTPPPASSVDDATLGLLF